MMDSTDSPPVKHNKPDSDCIIHSPSEDTKAPLIQLRDHQSWTTLLQAAQIRKHEPLLQIAADSDATEIPNINYHSKCRKLFTMKKSLAALEKKQSCSVSDDVPTRKSIRQPPCSSTVYDARCIICEKDAKYVKGTKTREHLQKCVTKEADESLRDAAVQKMDSRVIAMLSREAVAAEVHYHRSCYRSYTRGLLCDGQKSSSPEEEGYSDIEAEAFREVCNYVRSILIPTPQAVMFKDLREMLINHMKASGCPTISDSTKKNFRRKIETEFKDTIHFVNDDNNRLIVYPDCISKDKLVCDIMKMQSELDACYSSEPENKTVITKAALILRTELMKHKVADTWPPCLDDMGNTDKCIPSSVASFLHMLITGNKSDDQPSTSVGRQISSLGQDLIYAVTRGKCHPPKHILLPLAVKSLTGNVELIQQLNRLGHCVSYSMVEQIETALCIQKMESTPDAGIILPRNIQPHLFTTVAWDNIDRIEETLSGGGTSHRVNGIAIQQCFIGPHLPKQTHTVEKTKRRSLDIDLQNLPQYNAGNRIGPPVTITNDLQDSQAFTEARVQNQVWAVCRHQQPHVPSWTGFNIILRQSVEVSCDEIGYLPTINAPATDMSTVYEILQQSKKISQTLQLPYIVCVFDQALYAKAIELTWKHPVMFKDLVLHMGDFHTIFNFLATIGKRFQDAGLKDLAVESGVIAEGASQAVMDGRLYNRSLRFHKLVYEALLRLAWKTFPSWLEVHRPEKQHILNQALMFFEEMDHEVSETSLHELLQEDSMMEVLNLFNIYLSQLRDGLNGNLASLWISYIDMVDIVLGLVRAAREGNWNLHLQSIRAMIPWVFAYDRLNYARYLPYYYAAMTNLDDTHPGLSEEFQLGKFSVQLGKSNPFGRIPVDQAIEETINKDTQTAGGTKRFSLKPAAINKYYMSAVFRSMALRQLWNIVHHPKTRSLHADLHHTRIDKDYDDVKAIIDTLENGWVNPMSTNESDIICLSTGRLAPQEIIQDLLNAHTIGEAAYQKFKKERLESPQTTTKFYERMSKLKLKTFSDMKNRMSAKACGKEVILHADRNLFGRMILAAQSRTLDIKEVLSHPLGPIPWSLATPDGSLRKTSKASLAHTLVHNVPVAEVIPAPSACIIDGMSLLHKMKADHKSFGHLSEQIMALALQESAQCERLDIVFDVYSQSSIKNVERLRRGADTSIRFKDIHKGQIIHQWNKYLSCAESKSSLIEFLVREWMSPTFRHRFTNKDVYVTCGPACHHITSDSTSIVEELYSMHEEADTRIFLHAKHAADKGYQGVVITADDTDILVIALGLQRHIGCPIYQKTGTRARHQFLDISQVAAQHGQDVCASLIGLHAFTGCDSVSSFAGKGKVKPLKLLKKFPDHQRCFSQLGQSWTLSDDLFHQLESFTCQVYLPQSADCADINECHYLIFCSKNGEIDSSQLPPCRDSLYQHALRANHQAAIWHRSLEANMNSPDPSGNGWTVKSDNSIEITWMTGLPAPESVLELLRCDCRKSCIAPNCSCVMSGLRCTQMCKLPLCENSCEDVEEPHLHNIEEEDSDEEDHVN